MNKNKIKITSNVKSMKLNAIFILYNITAKKISFSYIKIQFIIFTKTQERY